MSWNDTTYYYNVWVLFGNQNIEKNVISQEEHIISVYCFKEETLGILLINCVLDSVHQN